MAEFNPEFNAGEILSGQSYDKGKNITIPFKQEMVPYSANASNVRVTGFEGNSTFELIPQDANQAQSKDYDIAEIQAAILSLSYSWFSYTSLSLPDTLTGINVTYSTNSGNGSSSHPAANMMAAFVNGGTISINPRSHSQASAAIIPDIQPLVSSVWTQELPTMNYVFYTLGNNTLEGILARVTQVIAPTSTTVTISNASPGVVSWASNGLVNGQTVLLSTTGTLPAPLVTTRVYYVVSASSGTIELALTKGGAAINTTTAGSGTHHGVLSVQPFPVFKTAYYTITSIGQQISVSADADAIATLNASFDGSSRGASSAYGTGTSQEAGNTVRTLRIGPVINGLITPSITGSSTATVTADATATTVALVLNGTTEVPAISSNTASQSGTVTASLSFSTIAATPIPAIPTSGLYLVPGTTSGLDDYGTLQVHAAVLDFSIFA